MRQAIIIFGIGTTELLLSAIATQPVVAVGLLWCGLVCIAVSVSMAKQSTTIFGKNTDGSLPLWSTIGLWPWHLFSRIAAAYARRQEEPFIQVTPGWFIGMWPHKSGLIAATTAIVDVTTEFPRIIQGGAYLCLPTWDGTAPTVEQISVGAVWATKAARNGPVLVHCTFGHSRSATILCAALVHAGVTSTWQQAMALIQEKRPTAHLTTEQATALTRWQKSID